MSYNINSGYGQMLAHQLMVGPSFGRKFLVLGEGASDVAEDRLQQIFGRGDPEGKLRLSDTMEEAFDLCEEGDTIFFRGNIREELTLGNSKSDITIVGVGNQPRHADSPWPTAATWKPPASPTAATPLLKIRSQGVRLINFLFDAPVDAAAVELERNAESGESEHDGSHFSAFGMRFVGGQSGIEIDGGAFNVRLQDNIFQDLTNGILQLNTAVSVPLQWQILYNYFVNNTHHIRMDSVRSMLLGNVSGKFTTTGFNLHFATQGANNAVHGNYLSGDYDAGYVAGTSDDWAGNYSMDVTSAEVGAEGLTILAPVA